MFDPATLSAYAAGTTSAERAQAVRDSLGSGTLTVELRDGETLVYSGTFSGPMTAGEDGSLSADVLLDGLVTQAGTPDAETWTCRIRNADSRYIEGSFGPGGRFSWSSSTLAVGQAVRLGVSVGAAGGPFAVLTDIESGNADAAKVVVNGADTLTPEVIVGYRAGATAGDAGWRSFLFAVKGAAGKTPTFRWLRAGHAYTPTLTTEWRPVWTQDFVTWHRAPSRTLTISYISWEFSEALPSGVVYVASHPVGRQNEAVLFAAELLGHSGVAFPTSSADEFGVFNVTPAENDDLGRPVGENPQFGIKLAFPGPTTDGLRKRKLLLTAGIHAFGEQHSWPAFVAAVRWILNSSEAANLRANWDVFLYFNTNPNGIRGGSSRHTFRTTTDFNRSWIRTGISSLAEIGAMQTAILADTEGAVDVAYAFHGANTLSTRYNLYMRTPNLNSGTRLPVYQGLIDYGEPIFGTSVNVVAAATLNTEAQWAEIVLGAKIAAALECQAAGNTSIEEVLHVGESWMKTLQAVDGAGLILSA